MTVLRNSFKSLTIWFASCFLLVSSVSLTPLATADIRDDLKACFDLSAIKESVKCLTELREADKINRPASEKYTDKAVVPALVKEAEPDPLADHARDIRKAITSNLDRSYITGGSGVHAGGDQTTASMLYEAQLFQNFSWLEWTYKKADATRRWDFWLDIPIRIGIRQLSVQSYPVRTPTFNPGLRLFATRNDASEVKPGAQYYSVGLHHYSNGQEGGEAEGVRDTNKVSGSFNTNYIEAAVQNIWSVPVVAWSRVAFRQHFYGTWERIQADQYPKRQVLLEIHSRLHEFPHDKDRKPWTAEFRVSETLGLGYAYVRRPGSIVFGDKLVAAPGDRAGVRDKLGTGVEISLKPPWWDDLSLYARYDNGYDYYNINFQNRMNRFQFGVVVR